MLPGGTVPGSLGRRRGNGLVPREKTGAVFLGINRAHNAVPAKVWQRTILGNGAMMISRLLCSPRCCSTVLHSISANTGRLESTHGLVGKILPPGTRVSVAVRSGMASGLFLSVDPRYEARYAAGVHETRLLMTLASHLRQGDVLYDVGAHVRLVCLVAARLVGSKARGTAFEADSGVRKEFLTVQMKLLANAGGAHGRVVRMHDVVPPGGFRFIEPKHRSRLRQLQGTKRIPELVPWKL